MAEWLLRFASYKRGNDIFEAVKSGEKTIETRPLNKKSKRDYSKIKPGDKLVMYSLDTKEKLNKITTYIHVYRSVEEMVESEPVEKIWPGVKTPNQLLAIYEKAKKKWGKSYAEKLDKYGIVVIGFK